MPYNTNEIKDFALPLPITRMVRRTAEAFASQQPTPQKAEQVRLNTLAVCVVNDYLQMMGIPTDLSVCDSWNPVVLMGADVADLEVTGVGRLECRPVNKHQQTCNIPPEVLSDRIGYVVVQINESSLEATVLGFAQTIATEELPISQLRPVEDLIDRLAQLMRPVAAATTAVSRSTRVNLSQWLVNLFETGWQTVETLLNPEEMTPAFRFRSAGICMEPDEADQTVASIKRAKLIDLGMQIDGYAVALIVELTPESEERRNILLQIHPPGNQTYLPPFLQLTVIDESGAIFLEAQARSADNYIQLQFSGRPREHFSVKVALGNASIIEDFEI